jgi:organic hydroperoxide reductase OsmC/OhrA
MKRHTYEVKMNWTGNDGEGTKDYRSYRRDHEVFAENKGPILGSSDPAFRGDAQRFSPEELLVSTLSSCHMLWYLHLCSVNGIVVLDYRDTALGEMDENADGSGQFTQVTLRPKITVALGSDRVRALTLHEEAHRFCFIARSVNFPVRCVAEIVE